MGYLGKHASEIPGYTLDDEGNVIPDQLPRSSSQWQAAPQKQYSPGSTWSEKLKTGGFFAILPSACYAAKQVPLSTSYLLLAQLAVFNALALSGFVAWKLFLVYLDEKNQLTRRSQNLEKIHNPTEKNSAQQAREKKFIFAQLPMLIGMSIFLLDTGLVTGKHTILPLPDEHGVTNTLIHQTLLTTTIGLIFAALLPYLIDKYVDRKNNTPKRAKDPIPPVTTTLQLALFPLFAYGTDKMLHAMGTGVSPFVGIIVASLAYFVYGCLMDYGFVTLVTNASKQMNKWQTPKASPASPEKYIGFDGNRFAGSPPPQNLR